MKEAISSLLIHYWTGMFSSLLSLDEYKEDMMSNIRVWKESGKPSRTRARYNVTKPGLQPHSGRYGGTEAGLRGLGLGLARREES